MNVFVCVCSIDCVGIWEHDSDVIIINVAWQQMDKVQLSCPLPTHFNLINLINAFPPESNLHSKHNTELLSCTKYHWLECTNRIIH